MIHPATEESIDRAAALLRAGEVVAFPTETVYGLGADATSNAAVRKIFELKSRPLFNPLIVHVSSLEQIGEVAQLEHARLWQRLEKLKRFWPGPLSVVVPKRPVISDLVTAGLDTVAIRIPRHPVALALLQASGKPLAAPSANRANAVSPTTAHHVEESFEGDALFVLDGGPCEVGVESTIVSLVGEEVELLRPGGVTLEELQSLFGSVKVADTRGQGNRARAAPGMLDKHYSPRTPLVFREQLDLAVVPDKVGLITFHPSGSTIPGIQFERVLVLSEKGSLTDVAARLFGALRELDGARLDLIVVDRCEREGIGLAIMDRLGRAVVKR